MHRAAIRHPDKLHPRIDGTVHIEVILNGTPKVEGNNVALAAQVAEKGTEKPLARLKWLKDEIDAVYESNSWQEPRKTK